MVEEGSSDVVQVSEQSEEAAPQLIVPHLSRKHGFKKYTDAVPPIAMISIQHTSMSFKHVYLLIQ